MLGPRFNLAAGLLIIFLIGLGLGVIYAPNPALAFVRWSFWLAASMTLFAVVRSAQRSEDYGAAFKKSTVLGALILAGFFIYGWMTDIRVDAANWPVRFSRIGHQNFTGDVMVMLVPLLVWVIGSPPGGPYRNNWRGGAVLALLVCLFMLAVGGMLGAIAGLGLGLALAMVPLIFSSTVRRTVGLWLKSLSGWVWGGLALLALLGGWGFRQELVNLSSRAFVFSSWEIPDVEASASDPQPPFSELWSRLTPVFGRRVPMWASTVGMIADAPLVGFGTDSFIPIYPGYSDRYPMFRDPENYGAHIKTNPHNAYLQVAAENGLPMLGLFCGLLILLSQRLLRSHWLRPNLWSFVASWAFVAMVFDAGFNHVFFNPASLFMVAITFGYGWARAGVIPLSPEAPCSCWLWRHRMVAYSLCVLVLTVLSVPARWIAAEYRIYGVEYTQARDRPSPPLMEAAWRGVLAWFPDHPSARFGLAKAQLDAGHYADAEASLHEYLQGMPYSVPGLSWLAMAQARQGQIDQAIVSLRQAQALEPDEKGFADSLAQLMAEQQRRGGK